jgi:hypothetical protein
LLLEFASSDNLQTPVSLFQLQPNETRSIAIVLNNDGGTVRLSGYTLELSIAGGGTPLGGSLGPAFTGVDLVDGTPFQSDHSDPSVLGGPIEVPGFGAVPQWLGLSLTTVSSPAPGEQVGAVNLPSGRSRLGTLTISAAGFSAAPAQPWTLAFSGPGELTFFDDAMQQRIVPSFLASAITVVPEPGHYALGIGCALLAFGAWRWSRR